MKKIFLSIVLFYSASVIQAQTKAPPANEIVTAAYKQAAEQHKNVMVIFTASWCGWCRKMDASINDSACKKFFDDNFVIVHLTVYENGEKKKKENSGAEEMLRKIDALGEGVPVWVIFDKDGKKIGDSFIQPADGKKTNIGCPASEKEVAAFIKVLKATSSLTDTELGIIAAIFRRNDDQ